MGACVCGVGREDGMRSDISSTNFESYIYFALPWGIGIVTGGSRYVLTNQEMTVGLLGIVV